MKRLATTIAAAGWMGFLGVYALELALDLAAPDLAARLGVAAWLPQLAVQFDGIEAGLALLGAPAKLLLAVICGLLVAVCAYALYLVHRPRRAEPATAEKLLGASLGAVSVLALATQVSGLPLLPIDPAGGLVWGAVAFGVAAVLFDRLVDTGETEDNEADFEAGITALAEGLARQTRLYSQPQTRRGD